MSPASPAPVLRAAQVQLRPVLADASPDEMAQLVFRVERGADAAKPTPEKFEHAKRTVARSAAAFAAHGYGLWWIENEATETFVGWCGLKDGDDPTRPELMYGLIPDARGSGYATEAVRAVVAHALTLPFVVSVWGATRPENTASAKVMERAGLHAKGTRVLDGREYLVFSTGDLPE